MDTAFLLRFLAGVFFILHGIVFPILGASYFKLYTIPGFPDGTYVFWHRFDVGETGIRIVGVIWMLSGVLWVLSGIGLLFLTNWWVGFTIATALVTLIPCILTLPDGKYGTLINLVILVLTLYLNGMLTP
jgi:hypothetical protein